MICLTVTVAIMRALVAQHTDARDSAGVRIVENRVIKPDSSVWRVVGPAPVVTIGGPGAKGNAALGVVMGALRLPDGDIVVADFNHLRVSFFNPQGVYRFGIDVTGPAGAREAPWNLFPIGHGDVAEWDNVDNQLMVLNSNGTVKRLQHVDNPSDARFKNGWMRQFVRIRGAFGTGEMLGTVMNGVLPVVRQTRTDSLAVYRIDAKGKLAAIGSYFLGERFTFAGHYVVSGQLPLGRNGSFAVGDNSWFYTDGSAFEVQRRSPSGQLLDRIGINRSRRPVTPEVIHRVKSAEVQRTRPELQADEKLALDWMPYPPREPAYTALQIDDEHHLWARIWAVDGDPATWDVFAESGSFLGTVLVPPDLDVLQIANGYLLARYTFDPSQSELRLYKLSIGH